jgi:transposase
MEGQRQQVVELVQGQRAQGRRVTEVLLSLGISRSSYYRWKKGGGHKSAARRSWTEITPEEQGLIDEIKEEHGRYRHRRIQGVLQQRGVYVSASAIYGYLKARGRVEP